MKHIKTFENHIDTDYEKHITNIHIDEDKKISKEVYQKILEIAKRHFYVKTLESQKSDSLDFRETSVWSIKDALIDAYNAGKNSI